MFEQPCLSVVEFGRRIFASSKIRCFKICWRFFRLAQPQTSPPKLSSTIFGDNFCGAKIVAGFCRGFCRHRFRFCRRVFVFRRFVLSWGVTLPCLRGTRGYRSMENWPGTRCYRFVRSRLQFWFLVPGRGGGGSK